MAADMEKDEHFRFLELPAELRDMVYDLLVTERREIPRFWDHAFAFPWFNDNTVHAQVTGIALSSLLLTSRQIYAEYSKRLTALPTLILMGGRADQEHESSSCHEGKVDLRKIKNVEFHDIMRTAHSMGDLIDHRGSFMIEDVGHFIGNISRALVNLDGITISLGLRWLPVAAKRHVRLSSYQYDPLEECVRFWKTPLLAKVIFHNQARGDLNIKERPEAENIYAIWTKEDHWVIMKGGDETKWDRDIAKLQMEEA